MRAATTRGDFTYGDGDQDPWAPSPAAASFDRDEAVEFSDEREMLEPEREDFEPEREPVMLEREPSADVEERDCCRFFILETATEVGGVTESERCGRAAPSAPAQ
jgi:hypothetical protein